MQMQGYLISLGRGTCERFRFLYEKCGMGNSKVGMIDNALMAIDSMMKRKF